jgi:hypothetical protein
MKRGWRVFLVGALIAAATLAVAAWLVLSEDALLKHLADLREYQCRVGLAGSANTTYPPCPSGSGEPIPLSRDANPQVCGVVAFTTM